MCVHKFAVEIAVLRSSVCEKENEKTKIETDDRVKSTAHVRCRKREYIKINLTSSLIETHIELNEEKIDHHTYTGHTQT